MKTPLIALAALGALVTAALAADLKISAMSPGSSLDGTEVAPFVQGGANVKITGAQIKSYAQTGLAAVAISGAAGDLTGTLGCAQMPALTGDVTAAAGACATTLANSGATAGTYGDNSHVAQVTVDAKGRVTSASSVAIVGVGSDQVQPGYVSGRWYLPPGFDRMGTPLLIGNGSARGSIAYIRSTVTISRLGVKVTTAFSSGNVQCAIYNSSPTTFLPTTLVGATSSMSTTSTGAVNAQFADTNTRTLTAGWYWFFCEADNGTVVLASLDSAKASAAANVGSTTQADVTGTSTGLGGLSTSTITFGSWPSDITSNTFSDVNSNSIAAAHFLVN